METRIGGWMWLAVALAVLGGGAWAKGKEAGVAQGAPASAVQPAALEHVLAGGATELDPDINFGYGTGQMAYDLGVAGAPFERGLRVHPVTGGAGWYVLAVHIQADMTEDAVVLQVNPNGEAVDEFRVQTPLSRIADAVMDPVTGKFYFVGTTFNAVLPDPSDDFGVTCVDITIPPDGGPCAGFGVNGTARIAFDLGGVNSDVPSRVVVRPSIGLLVAGVVSDGDKQSLAIASLYRATGAMYAPFGTNGRFVKALNASSPESGLRVSAMGLSNDPDEQTRLYVAGTYSIDDTGIDCDGYVVALKAMTGVPEVGFDGDGIRSVVPDGPGICSAPRCDFNEVTALAVQANGKLALAGFAYQDGIVAQPWVGRLNHDGSFDTGFYFSGIRWSGSNWPGHGGIYPVAIAERPDTRDLVVAHTHVVSNAADAPIHQLLVQWPANGSALRASASFEFPAQSGFTPSSSPSGLLVDAGSAMMVGARAWTNGNGYLSDIDVTLVRTRANRMFFDSFESVVVY